MFVYANDRSSLYVKRIIGLPGDRIEVDGTDIKVNGTGLRQDSRQFGTLPLADVTGIARQIWF